MVTNGAGSPRDSFYARYTDEDMRQVRRREQKKAAVIGEYCAVVLLDHPSSAVKDPLQTGVIEDLQSLLRIAHPETIYTHNPADKHDTHVAAALRLIQALCGLSEASRPKRLYGCEVWRDLDWLPDEDKTALAVGGHENLAAALLGVFDSQICGGKRYDLATLGRRRAHATYHASHEVDATSAMTFAMDLTPLLTDPGLPVMEYTLGYLHRFEAEVKGRIARLGS